MEQVIYSKATSFMANEGIYNTILYKSNGLYNEGLRRASVRDISGAIVCLRESLSLNRRNTNARNLLGLCYFEIGETVKALSQWIISRNNDGSKDNLARYYMDQVQSNQGALDVINQTIKKYNQALQYSYQGSYDLAVIQLKKVLSLNENLVCAYQLLTLVYIQTEEYEKARRTVVRGLRIDKSNTRLLAYLNEVDELLHELDIQSQDGRKKNVKKPGSDVMSYESGMDTIIQPIPEKGRAGFSSIVNIIIGIVMGVAICYALILPARIEAKSVEFDAMYKELGDELANEQALHNQDLATLDDVTKERDSLSDRLAKAEGTNGNVRPEDYLINAASTYVRDGASSEVMSLLDNITEEQLNSKSADFRTLYDLLKGNTSPEVINAYIEDAKNAMKSNNYEEAVAGYEKAYELDPTNSDLLMSLAHAVRQQGDIERANELYRKIATDFPDTQNAQDALEYITEDE